MLKIGGVLTLIGMGFAWLSQDPLPEQHTISLLPTPIQPPANTTATPTNSKTESPITTVTPVAPPVAKSTTIPVVTPQTAAQQALPVPAIAPPKPLEVEKTAPNKPNLQAINEQAIQLAVEGNPRQAVNLLEKSLIDHKEAGPMFENLRRLYAGFATQSYQLAMEPGKSKPVTVELLAQVGGTPITVPIAAQDMRARVVNNTLPAASALPTLPTETTVLASNTTTKPATEDKLTAPEANPTPTAAPAPVSTTPSASERAEASKAVMAAVKGWADAWTKQDVAGYIGAYSDTYHPKDMDRKQWEDYRKDRLSKPKFIRLELTELKAFMVTKTQMRVTFSQGYSSDTLKTKDKKTLELELIENQWRIISESNR
jgi:hypothetical protein